jgi:hypothetical protein
LHIAQVHAKELEKKLEASEKARSDAEVKATCAEYLRIRLNAAESALSDTETEQISHREAAIIVRLNKQSTRFSSTAILSLLVFCLCHLYICTKKFCFFQQNVLVKCIPGIKT